jgi:hypothetical protein
MQGVYGEQNTVRNQDWHAKERHRVALHAYWQGMGCAMSSRSTVSMMVVEVGGDTRKDSSTCVQFLYRITTTAVCISPSANMATTPANQLLRLQGYPPFQGHRIRQVPPA